ncbi:dephospho-CoA kinase [Tepiditoga spiralis]|uniref:Dephospho-CoA kinase n=1 Tax=Tepiditoga spiralis TaxID=2108365 RepID=A0A7G1G638_9BACT|nr:dephospho-CoA kinase [Tepiditoga spiralis]BBE30564.1 dephospho-CoA kinase [Tepiditoga spiralis]
MIIGLTGPAGSGKSTVSNIIKENYKNVEIIDVDRVGHYVLTLSFVKQELKKVFGSDIFECYREISEKELLQKNISRKKLGQLVFSNKENLKKLNAIVHPVIFNEIKNNIKILLKKYDIIVIDAALLNEIGLSKLCNKIIYVTAPKELRIKRLVENRHLPLNTAQSIVKSQKNMLFEFFDYKIINDCDKQTLKKIVANILN